MNFPPSIRRKRILAIALSVAVICAALAVLLSIRPGEGRPARVTVMLDFFANPNHVPIYAGIAEEMFSSRGIDVEVLIPANPADPLKLVAAGTIDVALTPQINFMIARSSGLPIVAIAALIDRSLGGLLTLGELNIRSLSDLKGKKVGYSLEPLEPILWRTMLGTVGVSPDEFELISTGFNTVVALLSHKVSAIGAFRNFELLQVELMAQDPVYFAQEDYGVPDTYEILLVVNESEARAGAAWIAPFAESIAEAIAHTKENPEEAFGAFIDAHPDLNDELNSRAYAKTIPLYADGALHSDRAKWEDMQRYLVSNGLMENTLPLDELYTEDFLLQRE